MQARPGMLASYFVGVKVHISDSLNNKIIQSVKVSMQIEGYKYVPSPVVKEQVKALMERYRVQVSIQRK